MTPKVGSSDSGHIYQVAGGGGLAPVVASGETAPGQGGTPEVSVLSRATNSRICAAKSTNARKSRSFLSLKLSTSDSWESEVGFARVRRRRVACRAGIRREIAAEVAASS